jgi:hypothetical protein
MNVIKNNNKERNTKNVKFAEEEQVHSVLRRRSQISRQSMADVWFHGGDFEAFLDDIEKSVDKLDKGKRLKDKKYSALGLENLTEEGSALHQAYQEDAWDAVLWEQHYQREDGKRSSVQIAQKYRDVSRESEQKAINMALQVHHEVLKYLTADDLSLTTQKSGREQSQQKKRSSSLPNSSGDMVRGN